MVLFIEAELGSYGLKTPERYVLLRDQAFLKLQFFAGDRASDNTFATRRVKNTHLFPVKALDDYISVAALFDIYMTIGFLFRLLHSTKQNVLEEPLTYSAIYKRLEMYLNVLGINEGKPLIVIGEAVR